MQPARRRSVVDVALEGGNVTTAETESRAKVLQRLRLNDTIFRNLTFLAALGVLILLGGVIVVRAAENADPAQVHAVRR